MSKILESKLAAAQESSDFYEKLWREEQARVAGLVLSIDALIAKVPTITQIEKRLDYLEERVDLVVDWKPDE